MRKAFTLIELLVVISIIALLIAILLPALSSAKYQANVTKCSIAVRSIAMVQISYAADSKEKFPEAGYRYDGTAREPGNQAGLSWTAAAQNGARVRSWELFGGLGAHGSYGTYDLRPIYYDYMQNNDQEAVMHCSMVTKKFLENNRDDRILSYMLYATNNFMTKHFYYEDVGAYERMGDFWSPYQKPEEKFTLLASDFVFGDYAPHGETDENGNPYRGVLSAHPSPKGAIFEQFAETNDAGGYVLAGSQEAPINFADADGSVHTYKVNDQSYRDTDTWVVSDRGNNRKALMPRDLAR